MIRIHHKVRKATVLGPGVRYVVWVQGCMQRCPGCVSPQAQPLDGGTEMPVDALVEDILSTDGIEGITISGGEPFLQAAALVRLIDALRARRDLGVIVYTGCLLEDLQSDEPAGAAELLMRIDLLIDGPYVDELNDDGALRGSSNQRVIPLTKRYTGAVADYGVPGGRKTELMFTADGFFLTGVPSVATRRLIRMSRGEVDEA